MNWLSVVSNGRKRTLRVRHQIPGTPFSHRVTEIAPYTSHHESSSSLDSEQLTRHLDLSRMTVPTNITFHPGKFLPFRPPRILWLDG